MIYSDFYYKLSRKFGRIIKSLYPTKKQLITMYSCRHQCIANMKNGGYKAVEIAVIVGHGNDVTATEHYGKKKVGHNFRLPIPNRLGIDKIKQFSEKRLAKFNNLKTIKTKVKTK